MEHKAKRFCTGYRMTLIIKKSKIKVLRVSQGITFAPKIDGACAVAIQVRLGTITSSPTLISNASSDINKAELPLLVINTYGTPRIEEARLSTLCTDEDIVNLFSSKANNSAFFSSSPISVRHQLIMLVFAIFKLK